MNIKLNNITISSIAHITEDEDKVLSSMAYFIPPEIDDDDINISTIDTEGCFGNPIRIHEIVLTKKPAKKTFKRIMDLLKRDERNVNKLKNDISTRIEKGKIYLRFDKQLACVGKCKLVDGDDVVRIVLGFNVYATKEKEEAVKETILNELDNWDFSVIEKK
ncbi:Protein of unknown function DUF54 [Methanococcus aeolicus Nankai-3]|uniref:Exosome subunit n=1 Tax=Methanococcus aeolicus (strain ATCC BAA-1280 / DSM 17508 / OCM 812 / Nankai-3) TaxID=419665 RepID=A6UWI4_META3|nr:RNA-binding domain-containing protein [Methanococcus aeolicus]ABR56856.1 Protein of unknown function DUF54 [Methanococcus aeolicus Nankai-3]